MHILCAQANLRAFQKGCDTLIIDTAGRVDRFKKKYAAQEAAKDAAKEEKAKK